MKDRAACGVLHSSPLGRDVRPGSANAGPLITFLCPTDDPRDVINMISPPFLDPHTGTAQSLTVLLHDASDATLMSTNNETYQAIEPTRKLRTYSRSFVSRSSDGDRLHYECLKCGRMSDDFCFN